MSDCRPQEAYIPSGLKHTLEDGMSDWIEEIIDQYWTKIVPSPRKELAQAIREELLKRLPKEEDEPDNGGFSIEDYETGVARGRNDAIKEMREKI